MSSELVQGFAVKIDHYILLIYYLRTRAIIIRMQDCELKCEILSLLDTETDVALTKLKGILSERMMENEPRFYKEEIDGPVIYRGFSHFLP